MKVEMIMKNSKNMMRLSWKMKKKKRGGVKGASHPINNGKTDEFTLYDAVKA